MLFSQIGSLMLIFVCCGAYPTLMHPDDFNEGIRRQGEDDEETEHLPLDILEETFELADAERIIKIKPDTIIRKLDEDGSTDEVPTLFAERREEMADEKDIKTLTLPCTCEYQASEIESGVKNERTDDRGSCSCMLRTRSPEKPGAEDGHSLHIISKIEPEAADVVRRVRRGAALLTEGFGALLKPNRTDEDDEDFKTRTPCYCQIAASRVETALEIRRQLEGIHGISKSLSTGLMGKRTNEEDEMPAINVKESVCKCMISRRESEDAIKKEK